LETFLFEICYKRLEKNTIFFKKGLFLTKK